MAYIGNVSGFDTVDTEQIKDAAVTAAKVAADVATQAELDTVSTVASAALPKAGGTMTGNLTVTVADNSSAINIISTDTDENSGPALTLTRDSGSPADNDYAGVVNFYSENSASESIRMGMIRTQVLDVTDGTEDSSLTFYSRHGGSETIKLATTSTGVDISGTVTSDGLTVATSATNGAVVTASDNATTNYPLLVQNSATSGRLELGTYGINNNIDLKLQRQGSTKLTVKSTGIDVTGTVTADGLVVDGNASVICPTDGTTELVLGEAVGTARGMRITKTGQAGGYEAKIFFSDHATSDQGSLAFYSARDTERMKIDSSGIVTKPYQPAFGVRGTTFTGTIYKGNQVLANIGSHFSTATGKFTAPVAGSYSFNFTLTTQDANSQFIDLYKNGASTFGHNLQYTDLYRTGSMTIVVWLAVGDYIEARQRGSYSVYNAQFSGHLIG